MAVVSPKLFFCDDEDMILRDRSIERGPGDGDHPRTDKHGNPIRTWENYKQLAMEEIERRLRTSRDTPQVFEIGKLSQRSREHLRSPCAYLALHFLYSQLDDQGASGESVFVRKADRYFKKGTGMLDAEVQALDYDYQGDGTFTADEQQVPFPQRIRRG